jgi:hypothetical protein
MTVRCVLYGRSTSALCSCNAFDRAYLDDDDDDDDDIDDDDDDDDDDDS